MRALTAGEMASDFSLVTLDGQTFALKNALTRGPVIVVFFKVSCPTCQYALPFLERIYQGYGIDHVTVVGVSQNNSKDTALFTKTFGISFPVLLDDTETYPVSNAYGLTNVPTIFWIGQDTRIEISSVGWDRKDFEEIMARMEQLGRKVIPIFHPGENVPAFRAG